MIDMLLGATALSVTPARGKEFARHADVTEYLDGVPFYFPQLHQPWQRGTNENTNGLLREYFPNFLPFGIGLSLVAVYTFGVFRRMK